MNSSAFLFMCLTYFNESTVGFLQNTNNNGIENATKRLENQFYSSIIELNQSSTIVCEFTCNSIESLLTI